MIDVLSTRTRRGKGPSQEGVRHLRVCCFPLRLADNSVLDAIYGPLGRQGVELFSYDWFLSNFRPADIFHVHWPDAVVMGASVPKSLIKFFALLASALRYRMTGAKIVYTVHNIGSHDRRHLRIESLTWRAFLPLVSTFVHMNRDSRDRFVARFPATAKRHHAIVHHPAYPAERVIERAPARRRLDLPSDGSVFLSVGLLRPYKGIEDIIGAFRMLQDRKAVLIIAGRASDPDYGRTIASLAVGDERIRLVDRFLSNEELDEYLAACDAVTMAHRAMNNSGVALLALSRGRRLVAPAHPAIVELQENVGGDWVMTFEGQISAAVLAKAACNGTAGTVGPDLSSYEPNQLAEKLLTIFRMTVNG